MSFHTTAFRPLARAGWGGRASSHWRGPVVGRMSRGPIGTAQSRSKGVTSNPTLTGISRDSAGAPTGTCQILAFCTVNKTLAGETTSDASGNWSMVVLTSGPFFLVEYKDGGTPVAGSSLNTLLPVRA